MKKNKYLVFISIGFELISLLAVAIVLGNYLEKQFSFGSTGKAFLILTAFLLWFIMLIVKLRNTRSDD